MVMTLIWKRKIKNLPLILLIPKICITGSGRFKRRTMYIRLRQMEVIFYKNSLDAGIQDRSTSISIVVKFD